MDILDGYALTLNASGYVVTALFDTASRMPAVSVANAAMTSGDAVNMQLLGVKHSAAWNFNGGAELGHGKTLWVGNSGLCTTVIPVASGQHQQKVGASYDGSGAIINVDSNYTLLS
jgi:hypothetical protein